MSEQKAMCAECLDQLDDFRRGILPDAEMRTFEQHLAGCTDCTTALQEAEAIGELLRFAGTAELPAAEDFAQMRESAWAAMENEETVRVLDVPRRPGKRPPLTWMVAAAVLVVMVGYSVLSSRIGTLSNDRTTAVATESGSVKESAQLRAAVRDVEAQKPHGGPDKMDAALNELKNRSEFVLADSANAPDSRFETFKSKLPAQKSEQAAATGGALPASSSVPPNSDAPASPPAPAAVRSEPQPEEAPAAAAAPQGEAEVKLFADSVNDSKRVMPSGSVASPQVTPSMDTDSDKSVPGAAAAGLDTSVASGAKGVHDDSLAPNAKFVATQSDRPAAGPSREMTQAPMQAAPPSHAYYGVSGTAGEAQLPQAPAPPALVGHDALSPRAPDANDTAPELPSVKEQIAAAAPAEVTLRKQERHELAGERSRTYPFSVVEDERKQKAANTRRALAAAVSPASGAIGEAPERRRNSHLDRPAPATAGISRAAAIAPGEAADPQTGGAVQSEEMAKSGRVSDAAKKLPALSQSADENRAWGTVAGGEGLTVTATAATEMLPASRTDNSWYFKAEDARLSGKSEDAIASYKRVLREQPGTAAAAKAQLHIADIELDQRKDSTAALEAYKACLAPDLARHFDEATLQAIRLRISQLEAAKAE